MINDHVVVHEFTYGSVLTITDDGNFHLFDKVQLKKLLQEGKIAFAGKYKVKRTFSKRKIFDVICPSDNIKKTWHIEKFAIPIANSLSRLLIFAAIDYKSKAIILQSTITQRLISRGAARRGTAS